MCDGTREEKTDMAACLCDATGQVVHGSCLCPLVAQSVATARGGNMHKEIIKFEDLITCRGMSEKVPELLSGGIMSCFRGLQLDINLRHCDKATSREPI